MSIILKPFAWLLMFFNNITGSYGLALILFALLVKIILFPFSYKGKKSMIKTSMLQGRMKKLQEQYKNNKQKYNEEVQKLYQEEKINPMGGCLWSIIPLIVLMLLYSIIRQPLQYMMGMSATEIANVAKAVNWNQLAVENGWIKEAASYAAGGYNELFLASLIKPENLHLIQTLAPGASVFNFQFLGMNLAQVPTWRFWTMAGTWNNIGLFIMPIISAALSVVFSIVSMRTNNINGQAQQQQGGTAKMMMVISPLLSLWIGYAMPAGLCVYWIVNNLLSMAQEFICAKMLKKDYEAAAAAQRQQELLAKEEEKRRKAALAEERARRAEERKKGGKKKSKPASGEAGVDANASRVGIRAYARGRAYDPERYGGVTAYKDPEVDENAIEAVLEKRAAAKEEADREAELVARIEAEVAQEFKEGKLVETSDEAVAAAEKAAEEAEREADELYEEDEPEALEAPEEAEPEADDAEAEAETDAETDQAPAEDTAEETTQEKED